MGIRKLLNEIELIAVSEAKPIKLKPVIGEPPSKWKTSPVESVIVKDGDGVIQLGSMLLPMSVPTAVVFAGRITSNVLISE